MHSFLKEIKETTICLLKVVTGCFSNYVPLSRRAIRKAQADLMEQSLYGSKSDIRVFRPPLNIPALEEPRKDLLLTLNCSSLTLSVRHMSYMTYFLN